MKKFKLIKEYPGSPKLGEIVEGANSSDFYYYEKPDLCRIVIRKKLVDNQPEYWKQLMEMCFVVSERDYSQGNYNYFKEWTVYKIYEDNQRDSMLNYFETEEEAKSFIFYEKPCLSLNDVLLRLTNSKTETEECLEEFVKQLI
jgi:hypothetical protein